MDSEFGTERSEVITFLKANLLFVGLLAVGLIVLGIGLIQFLKPNESVEVLSVTDSSADAHEKSVSKGITIDVSGAVNNPGVYEFSDGARIKDAIRKAGGLAEDADRDRISKEVNLAQPLQDGVKIYIPKRGDSASSSSSSSNPTGKINVNTASATDLDSLSGVGPKTVDKIVAGRPYTKVEELVSKKALGQSVFEKIKEQISVY